jgi:uncharacterized membrane protein (UPF0136 family)
MPTTAEAGDILAPGRTHRNAKTRRAMDDVRQGEEGAPAPVAIAAMIGFAKALFEAGFGLLGIVIANSMDDSFGGGMLVFGIVYAIASLLLLRGSRAGYYVTVVLSALGLVVAVLYLFRSESAVFGATLVAGGLNALVLYLLLWRKSAREYFGH